MNLQAQLGQLMEVAESQPVVSVVVGSVFFA
jgi:hypothetical protein